MRDHAKVMASIWTGKTGRALRGQKDAQILAFFLLTCRHANMSGLYELPLSYAARETGLTVDEVAEAMKRLGDADVEFAYYDHDMEFVWVVNMAPVQLDLKPGRPMSPNDKRHSALARQVDAARRSRLHPLYLARYAERLALLENVSSVSPKSEGPSKGLPAVEKGHPATQSGAGAGAGAGAGLGTTPERHPLADDASQRPAGGGALPDWTAERAAVVFAKMFDERWGTVPSMGGRNIAGFHETVAQTAAKRNLEPEILIRETIAAWFRLPDWGDPRQGKIMRQAPYACFVQSWGALTMAAQPGAAHRKAAGPSIAEQFAAKGWVLP